MKKTKRMMIVAALCCVAVLPSCSPKAPLYAWYNYDDVAYELMKDGTEANEEALRTVGIRMVCGAGKVDGLKDGGTVPPGVYAEVGYIYFKQGKKDLAVQYFEKEMEAYPESKVYVSRILKQLK